MSLPKQKPHLRPPQMFCLNSGAEKHINEVVKLEFWSQPYDNSFNTPAMPLDEAHSGGFFSSRIC
jgi:hypothetical protein